MTDDIDRSHHDHEHSPPGPHALPPPPIPEDCDLRKFPWMKFNVDALLDSDFWRSTRKRPDIRGIALALWAAAWHQVPAASLPDDIIVIADHADLDLPDDFHGMTVSQAKVASGSVNRSLSDRSTDTIATIDRSLHGFTLHSDGRWYHAHLVKLANEEIDKKGAQSKAAKKTNRTRWKDKQNSKVGQPNANRQRTDRSTDRSPIAEATENRERENREGETRSPLTPASGGTRAAESSPSAQEREAPASPAERGSARTEFADRPTSPPTGRSRDIDPEASASRKQTMDNSSLKAEFGFTSTEMVDALHQACFGSNRLIANSPKLESAEAIIALMRDNPGVSFTLDVLPAIKARVSRSGDKIGSWAFFGDAIRGWSQNRVSGAGNGAQDNWPGKDKGVPPSGHPWPKQVIDERTRMLRCYGGHWDWEWFDRVGKYQRIGEWDESFAKELPGRPSSSCPDDICAHYGIVPQARREGSPIIDMRAVREVQARRAEEARRGVIPMPPAPDSGRVAVGLPTGVAGQVVSDDDVPPF